VIKLFATASIRDGGKQTMTTEQINATCGEAKAVGLRAVVHAHRPMARARRFSRAARDEHGTMLDNATLDLMRTKGVFFDPNSWCCIITSTTNRISGHGIITTKGSRTWRRLAAGCGVLRRARAHHVMIVFGTDAVADRTDGISRSLFIA